MQITWDDVNQAFAESSKGRLEVSKRERLRNYVTRKLHQLTSRGKGRDKRQKRTFESILQATDDFTGNAKDDGKDDGKDDQEVAGGGEGGVVKPPTAEWKDIGGTLIF